MERIKKLIATNREVFGKEFKKIKVGQLQTQFTFTFDLSSNEDEWDYSKFDLNKAQAEKVSFLLSFSYADFDVNLDLKKSKGKIELKTIALGEYEEVISEVVKVIEEVYGFKLEQQANLKAYMSKRKLLKVYKDIRNVPIEEIPLSDKIIHALKKCGFDTVGKVGQLNTFQLFAIYELGEKSVDEIVMVLRHYGIKIKNGH